jgi:hypothetical protein
MKISRGQIMCVVCIWGILWLGFNIYWTIHYANYHKSTITPPDGSLSHIPPTLSYKKLVITKNSLAYDGELLNNTKIYF